MFSGKLVEIIISLIKSSTQRFDCRGQSLRVEPLVGLLFCFPSNVENYVLFKYHHQMGHLGCAKTKELISRTYWFSNLNEKTKRHVRNCLKCISFFPSSGKVEGFVHIVPKGDVPFTSDRSRGRIRVVPRSMCFWLSTHLQNLSSCSQQRPLRVRRQSTAWNCISKTTVNQIL